MSARWTLHLAALIAPFAAASLWWLLMPGVDAGIMRRQLLLFGALGAVSAQIAALLRWHALERRAREGHGAWLTGIGMAAITHVLFGVFGELLLVLAIGDWHNAAGTRGASGLVLQMLFFFVVSVFAIGSVSFPATALLANWIATMRRRELAHGVR